MASAVDALKIPWAIALTKLASLASLAVDLADHYRKTHECGDEVLNALEARRRDIEAHLTVVMAALAVARHLQETTGISIKRIIRTLKPLQDVTINLNGHHLTAADPLTPEAEEILTALSIPTGH